MSEQNQIRFEDGAAYETYMGIWSRKVGEEFLAWLKPPRDLSWLDVGCGNGAFTAPGGLVSAYMWDWPEGFPFHHSHKIIEDRGLPAIAPPSWEASREARLVELWQGAGLADVESRVITVERTFPDFETLWAITLTGPRVATLATTLSPVVKAEIRKELKDRLGVEEGRPVTLKATANAVKGRVPG